MIFLKRYKRYVAAYIIDLPNLHNMTYGCSITSTSTSGIGIVSIKDTLIFKIVLKEQYLYEYADKAVFIRSRNNVLVKNRQISFKITDRRFMTIPENIDDPESYDTPNEYYEDGAIIRKLNLLQHFIYYTQQMQPYKSTPEFSSKLCLHKKCRCEENKI